MVDQPRIQAERALAYYELGPSSLTAIDVGLINITFRVESGSGCFALQRLNPIFGAGVNQDIEAVTLHIEARGLETPKMVRTRSGELWVDLDGEVWRMLTWMPGDNLGRADSPVRTQAAGKLLGRFHAAVQDLEHDFVNARLGVHDTPAHLKGLAESLESCSQHRLFERLRPVAQEVLQLCQELGPVSGLPDRVVHGDPKLNNLIFDPDSGEGRCLIDLDTLARMPVVLELGDAFRSWCNPAGEDEGAPTFDMSLFEGALAGYGVGAPNLLQRAETEALVRATATIMLELAARFAKDALLETYFGWDAQRFGTRGEHNLVRAQIQLGLAKSLLDRRSDAERVVKQHLGR